MLLLLLFVGDAKLGLLRKLPIFASLLHQEVVLLQDMVLHYLSMIAVLLFLIHCNLSKGIHDAPLLANLEHRSGCLLSDVVRCHIHPFPYHRVVHSVR